MATALDLLENIQAINIAEEARKAVNETAHHMADLNREQLSAGYDAKGHKLTPHYSSRSYAAKKNAMNPEPGMWHPDLMLTGAFAESFKASATGDDIEFEASDPKANELLEKYGDDVLGLFETQQEYYNERIFYPVFSDAITEVTGLIFE